MGTYENGEEITHWYISDIRRMTNSYNNAIYNYLGITFPSKYEESFTVDFSSAGSFDRVDCSSNSPIWYFRNESGKWEKDFEKEYKSFKEFKSSDYFYEEQGIEYNLEMYNSMKETFSINRFICRQL